MLALRAPSTRLSLIRGMSSSTGTALYRATVTASGKGRNGNIKGTEGFAANLAMPKSLGGPGNDASHVNPEILFAGGYSSCFLSALQAVAGNKKVKLPAETSVQANVDLLKGLDGFSLAAELEIKIPGMGQKEADGLVKDAHAMCPYSKAIEGNVSVKVRAVV